MSYLARLALLLALFGSFSSSLLAQATENSRDIYERSVVSLQITYQGWDNDRPWAKLEPRSRSASAVLIDDTHLLTTAQMLDHATYIRLNVFGEPRTYEPRIAYIDRSINLALIAVDDPAVLEGLTPVPAIATQTPTSGNLTTVRWRGQQLEAASSRVVGFVVAESRYSQVSHAFVHMRTDMANGGWADPVFSNGELVGMTVSQSKQVSRAIPAEILSAFLGRLDSNEPPVGFTEIGANWQVNRDPGLTSHLGQKGEPQGVVIRTVTWGTSACGVLEPRDILLEVNGKSIDAGGNYQDSRLGRLPYGHLFTTRNRPGDKVPIKVLRDGRELDLEMTARAYPDALNLIRSNSESAPPFVIVGGLLMRELDAPYLRTWGDEWTKNAPDRLLTLYNYGRGAQTPQRRRRVLITAVLPSSYNIGYENIRDQLVEKINGQSIDSIPDILDALRQPLDSFHVIELAPGATRGRIVLDAATLDAATQEIVEAYGIPLTVRLPDSPPPEGGGECTPVNRYQ